MLAPGFKAGDHLAKLRERFTFTADGDLLKFEFKIDDSDDLINFSLFLDRVKIFFTKTSVFENQFRQRQKNHKKASSNFQHKPVFVQR